MNTIYINEFIEKMLKILPEEIIFYIIKRYIYLPQNINIIKKQKVRYKQLLKQLNFVSNIVFIDSNCCVYIQNNNIVVSYTNQNIELYSPSNYITNVTTTIDNMITNIFTEPDNLYTSNIQESILDLLFHNYTPEIIPNNYNSNLLLEINSNINSIYQSMSISNNSNILSNSINLPYYTSNIILHTSHQDMDDIIFYILYS